MRKIVGFDIGEHSVKMVSFVGNELKQAIDVELPDAMVSGSKILSMDAMADFLRKAAKDNNIPGKDTVLLLPGSELFVRTLTMPAMTEQQLNYNLPYEFHDFLEDEKSKYFFDYAVQEIHYDENGNPREMDIFACAVLKSVVESYRAMFRRAGFRLCSIVPTECAYSSLLNDYIKRGGASEKDRAVIGLGHGTTRLYIYHGGRFENYRVIDLGIRNLEQRVAEEYGVDIHLAHSYVYSNYENLLNSEYARELYGRMAVEVRKAVNFYNYHNRDRELQDVYFCGGGAGIEPLVDIFTNALSCQVHSAAELIPNGDSLTKPWRYLRVIGGVYAGMEGGLL